MPEQIAGGTVRIKRLWSAHQSAIGGHFARLEPETLRLRFGGRVRPGFVADYAEHILDLDAVVFGAFDGARIIAVAELHGLAGVQPAAAEAAFSVEPEWQDMGIGNALMCQVVSMARTRGIGTVHLSYLTENARMRRLARRHKAVAWEAAERNAGAFAGKWSSLHAIAAALADDTAALVHAVLQPAPTAR